MTQAGDFVTGELALAQAEDWRGVLATLVAEHPKGKQGVADVMGVSRVYVSRVFMTGPNRIEHPGKAFVAKVWGAVGAVACPHLGRTLATADCKAHATRSWGALSGQDQVQHWRACQRCPHNPAAVAEAMATSAHADTRPDAHREAGHA